MVCQGDLACALKCLRKTDLSFRNEKVYIKYHKAQGRLETKSLEPWGEEGSF